MMSRRRIDMALFKGSLAGSGQKDDRSSGTFETTYNTENMAVIESDGYNFRIINSI